MKKSIFLLLVLLSSVLSAQVKVTGKVTSKDNNPIEFAEVILIGKDSAAIKSELTNEKGDFVLESQPGVYELQVRQANKTIASRNIELNADLDLGNIVVDAAIVLESVVVVGKKKLIERKVDRVVFNVENSISATGGDALEALRITPGIKVQNDNIAIIGKSSVAVMVDDKIIQLSEEDLANFLKSIPSDIIKSIEVITTPPAKYEAAGNSGMVNIKLKKAKKDSWNALIGTTFLQRTYSDGAVLGSFNYNKNKLSISSSLNYKNGTRYVNQDNYTYFPDGLWHTSEPDKEKYARVNGKLTIDYQISPKWIMGGQFLYNNNDSKNTESPFTGVTDYTTGRLNRYLKSDGKEVQNPNIKSLSFYNEFKLDTIGKKLTLNLDYFNFNNKDVRTYNGISVIEVPLPYSEKYYAGINDNSQDINNFSGKLDIDYPTKWAVLSFGSKISNSQTHNDIFAFNSGLVDTPPSEFILSKNKFEYTENVQAFYISGNKKINEYWESQFGLRMEATQTKTFAESLSQSTKLDYVKFFPTAYVSYKPNDNSTYTLSYSKRIERPQFYDLNPNVTFLNPFQTIEGNPFLQPSFIDNLELTYTYKKLETKVYFSYQDDMFNEIPITDPTTNLIRFAIDNFIDIQRYGISENFVFDKIKWWTSINTFDINYSISKSKLAITQGGQKGFNSMISTNNDFILNSKKTLLFNLNYWYSFPGNDGFYKNDAMSSLSLTLQYLLLDKDLTLSLKGSDIFRTEVISINSRVNDVYNEGRYYRDRQALQFSVSYKFGNKKIKTGQRETGNEEERSRTGN
ncbi:TonB-dependent receptor domain-containing protein [Flavobacterium collinsii]|uniref:TonB-dependent outer membrane receptor n=1 Tax=Flavobacterium collinsii TaxID=1114861 RepID=A0A9W4TL53_9FLAO|nr:TonB-dependent receptor [Flavobacterium collinsii]CAI2768944.1 TonB-dependent outer membrane receptor precursor [Flavobacterium collinsii]